MTKNHTVFAQEVANLRFVIVNEVNGEFIIHIRKYEYDEIGNLHPTREGISFDSRRFAAVMEGLYKRNKHMLDTVCGRPLLPPFKMHIGGGCYITMDPGMDIVHFRQYTLSESAHQPIPTALGTTMKLWHVLNLTVIMQNAQRKFEVLTNAQVCACAKDDANDMDQTQCLECQPFGKDICMEASKPGLMLF